MKFALACLPTVREEQVAAVAVVAAGERMTKLGADGDGKRASKQTMGTVSRISAAGGGESPEAWCSVGGEWVRRVDKIKGSAAECSGSSGPAAARAVEWE